MGSMKSTGQIKRKPQPKREQSQSLAALIVVIIILLGLGGLAWWLLQSAGPETAQDNRPSPAWPEETGVDRFADRHAIVMFVKPNDPQSIAHLESLEQVARQRRVYSTVVLSKTGERNLDDHSRNVVQRAQQIPNSNVIFDDRGQESTRFGLFQTPSFSVYGPGGELVTTGNSLPSQSTSVMNLLPHNPATPTYAGVSHGNRWTSSNQVID